MAPPIRVASVCRDLPGPDNPAGGIFVWRRLDAMARQAPVTTLQPVPYFPGIVPLPDWAREPHHDFNGLRIEHLPMFYFPKYLKSLDGSWLYRSIRDRLKELKDLDQVDVVDAHFGYPEGVGALRAARELGIPFYVTLRGFEAEYIHKPLIGSQIKKVIREADGCICVAEFLREIAIAQGARPERTRVIHNAINRKEFCIGDRAAARARLDLPAGAPIVVSVGHLTARKRHHILISAFAAVRAKLPDAILLIVGTETFERSYPRQLERQVERLGIANSVSFLGNVEPKEVADLLRAADVFALATQREGCCNAVLEALTCGIPVVTTPVGDNALFVKNGENGYIVPVDDFRAMADAMSTVLRRKTWDRRRISLSSGVGDWDDVAAKALAFFDETRSTKLRAA